MTGSEMIAAERKRQIEKEGWTPEHDDEHDNGELALAAICFAAPVPIFKGKVFENWAKFVDPWPWDEEWDKRLEWSLDEFGETTTPKLPAPQEWDAEKRLDLLVKAGALIAAEIDRLKRVEDQ